MRKWALGILGTVIISVGGGFLAYVSKGIADSHAITPRVMILEQRSEAIQNDIGDFKSSIKEDIGHIKGQNDIIIKLLKQREK